MGANNNNSIDKIEEIWEYDEKMKKRELVINTIVQRSAFSSHQILQGINEAASPSSATGSSKVEAIVLSGGYTNYSYKIFVPGQPHLCLFAKLTFERAIWNPDKDALYDLQRTVNEYELMATFSKIMPDCVVAPLALWDVEHEGQKMKLLVTEWSKADEQFSNQFIDGSIDPRAAPKLASALAAISSMTDYDPHFNEQAKSYMDTQAAKHLRSSIEHLCLKCKPKDRTENYCSMMGAEIMLKVIDANYVDFHRSDCLVHSDSHAFNILVEAKPNEQDLDLFAPDGTVVLCDFEMASVGPFGRDAGLVLSWPLACMLSHALKNTESNANIQIRRFIETFLTCYLSEMSTGRTAKEMAYMYRRCYGWAGLFMVAVFYLKGGFVGEAPGAENEKARDYVRDSMGVLGLKLMRVCYDTEYVPETTTLKELTFMFNTLVDEELTQAYALSTPKGRVQPRKSSLLRISNRRVSDAGIV